MGRGDDAAVGEKVDDVRRVVVAPAHPALEMRRRGAMRFQEALDRRPDVVIVGRLLGRRCRRLEQHAVFVLAQHDLRLALGVICRLGLAALAGGRHDAADLRVGNRDALREHQRLAVRLEKQRAAGLEIRREPRADHRLRVVRRLRLEREARCKPRRKDASEMLVSRILRRRDEMDSNYAPLAQETHEQRLVLLRRKNVRQVVQHDHDRREFLRLGDERVVDAIVELIDIADARLNAELHALLHLQRRPLEREDDPLRIGDDGDDEMRKTLVECGEARLMRVRQNEMRFLGRLRREESADQRVEARRAAGVGLARDEQMRKRRQVGDDRTLVVAQPDGQGEVSKEELPRPRLQNLAERNSVGERRARAFLLRDFLLHGSIPCSRRAN